MPNGDCPQGAQNKARIDGLEVNVERLIDAIEQEAEVAWSNSAA